MSHALIEENFSCTGCDSISDEEKECCGSFMIERTEVEGFGLNDFEPAGTNSYDLVDEWN